MEENIVKLSRDLTNLKILNIDFQKKYNNYGFKVPSDFLKILELIMWTRKIEWVKEVFDRGTAQDEFRKNLIIRDKKCVVSQKHIAKECQACHIIPFSEGGSYSISNGLLIANTFHKLFDDFYWSINPKNYKIDVLFDDEEIVGSIYEYKDKKINVEPTQEMTLNINWHWNKYLDHKLNSLSRL